MTNAAGWIGALAFNILSVTAGYAATDVWVFYGAGPHFLSSGMNQIARRARTLSGVGAVHGPYDYRETQRAYNEIMAAPPEHSIVISGYSCGGNAALSVAQGLARNSRAVNLALIQPSVWCGWYLPTTANVGLAQNSYSGCIETFGLGCLRLYGAAQENVNIYRPSRHLRGDNDPASQRDVLSAIYRVANPRGCDPSRHQCHAHTLVVHRAPGGGMSHTLIHHE